MNKERLDKEITGIKIYHDNKMNELIQEIKNNRSLPSSQRRKEGGLIRSVKGTLGEEIARRLVNASWQSELNQDPSRLTINKRKVPIKVFDGYIEKLPKDIQDHWLPNVKKMKYRFGTDVHVYIDNIFRLPIECKAFTENAMIKRILVDANLLKEALGINYYILLQLESQLGGDFSQLNQRTFGSESTHVLMSHFTDIKLEIITMLPGERLVKRPTHEQQYFKELPTKSIRNAISIISNALAPYSTNKV